jgi:molecular chaperone GrpE
MAETDNSTDIADRLLKRFDFASELADIERRYESRMRAVLLSFVEVMDSFDRFLAGGGARDTAPGPASSTVGLIAKQLDRALQEAGVARMACSGKVVEPGRHEVDGTQKVPHAEPDTIVEEIVKGYEWDGRVLRKARVIVAD